jgi:hypothetical protein
MYFINKLSNLCSNYQDVWKTTLHICEHENLRKVDIFVIKPQEAEWFHLGEQNMKKKTIKIYPQHYRIRFFFRIPNCWNEAGIILLVIPKPG